jgi:predicted XRE-type DNA-binding protein
MPKNKAYRSIPELVRDIADSSSFADGFESRLANRKIVKDLMVLRATQGLSQKDVALRLGCTQSRISKLESMTDADLRIGDLSKYAEALGLQLRIILEPTNQLPAARVNKRDQAIATSGDNSRRKSVST